MKNFEDQNLSNELPTKPRTSMEAWKATAKPIRYLGIFIVSIVLLIIGMAVFGGKSIEQGGGPVTNEGWRKAMGRWGQ